MNKIKSDTAKLASTERSVREQIRAIKKSLQKMKADVTSLNAMWSGTANQSFNQTFQKDIQDLDQLCGELEKIAEYENKAQREYSKGEQRVNDIIAKIKT